MEEHIKISVTEYLRLRIAAEELSRLEAGGVDNWDFYGDSLNPDGEESMSEARQRIEKEILNMPKI